MQGKVQALAFSASEKWLASIGGPDDGALVIWDVATGKSLCGASVSATDVACFHHDPDRLATCGRDSMLCVWHVDGSLHKLLRVDAMLGQMRRDFTCLSICADDHLMYAGSASGDMAEVRQLPSAVQLLLPTALLTQCDQSVTVPAGYMRHAWSCRSAQIPCDWPAAALMARQRCLL